MSKNKLADSVLNLLPLSLRLLAEDAIEKKSDWNPTREDFDKAKLARFSHYFVITDDWPDQYPDGFWHHAIICSPAIRIIDGDVFIGYEGYYDCDLYCDDGSRFYSLTDAKNFGQSIEDVVKHLDAEMLTITAKGQGAYREWMLRTGRDPYRFAFDTKEAIAMNEQAFGMTLENLTQQAIEQGLIKDLVEDDGLPMVKFPDGENLAFDDGSQAAIALYAVIKGAEMQRMFGLTPVEEEPEHDEGLHLLPHWMQHEPDDI